MPKELKNTLIAATVSVVMVVVIFVICRLLHCDKTDIAFALAVSALIMANKAELRGIDNEDK